MDRPLYMKRLDMTWLCFVSPTFYTAKKNFWKKSRQVAEWSALQTGKRGDSSSIPAKVRTFFSKIKSLQHLIAFPT